MIVTQDNGSSYELAPTLRLFVQPIDLLPPPPAQVDGKTGELAPEYIDPLAGLPKYVHPGLLYRFTRMYLFRLSFCKADFKF